MTAANGAATRRWKAHPWRARALRLLVYALPIAGSLGFVRLATWLVEVPTSSLWIFLAWWLGISVAATLVVSALYAVTRRLLPVGALLGLSLIFPDEAPSRFRLAMSAGTVESLEDRLALMRKAREAPTAQAAAENLLQLVAALDVHDKITRGHAERVRGYSYALATQIGLTGHDLDRLNWAALLHDIGKLEVSTEILNKPGKPTDEEWEQLRRHPLYGETIVEPLDEWLGNWTTAVGYHHERWDGKGYPRGLAGEDIPFAGRIVAIADVFDVITSARSYKEASNASDGRAEIARCSGSQFDPHLVRAFVNISLGRMRLVMGPVSWLTHAPLLARFPLTPSIGAALGGLASLATAATVGLAAPHAKADAPLNRRALAPPAVSQPEHRAGADGSAGRPAPTASSHRGRNASPAPVSGPGSQQRDGVVSPSAPVETSPAPPAAPAADPPAAPPAPPAPQPPSSPPAPSPTPAPPASPPASPPAPPASPPPPPPAPPPPNVAPTFTAGTNQATLEDAAAQSIAGWATSISPGPANESSQTVTFTVGAANPSLFGVQPAVGPSGALTYTPASNENGVTNVTVTAHDDGGIANGGSDTSASQVFSITLTPVNDAPSFVAGPNQSGLSPLGPQTVAGWATGITPGPADETSQSVVFAVTNDNPGLFSAPPAVASNGTLTYTPALLAIGSANITVRAVDNGGTSNGGIDTSPPQTFTITIL
jgi:hypothetical protein